MKYRFRKTWPDEEIRVIQNQINFFFFPSSRLKNILHTAAQRNSEQINKFIN